MAEPLIHKTAKGARSSEPLARGSVPLARRSEPLVLVVTLTEEIFRIKMDKHQIANLGTIMIREAMAASARAWIRS